MEISIRGCFLLNKFTDLLEKSIFSALFSKISVTMNLGNTIIAWR